MKSYFQNFSHCGKVASALLLATFTLQAAPPVESPYNTPQPPFYGQVRLRTEYDSKDVRDTLPNKPFLSTQMRSRIGFLASPSMNTEVKVEMQDVRNFGSEPTPAASAANPATASTGNAKGVDLLQGYFSIEEGIFKTVMGRQKMSLGAGRFLSTLEWSPTSRAFDGLSFNLNLDPGNLTGVAYLVKDTSAVITKDRLLLSGLYYTHQITPDITGDVYGFYDQSRLGTTYAGVTSSNYDLQYYGERVAGKVSVITFEEEFIWQGGELYVKNNNLSSAAFQLATRIGYANGPIKVNAGVDMMSGDDDSTDSDLKSYRANYYFAHAYYGWMDYFITNPKYGVIDYRLDADIALFPNATGNPRVTIKPQYHYFTPQAAPTGLDDPYGQEFNLELHVGLYPKSNIVLGAAVFLPGDMAKALPAAKITNKAFSSQPGWFLYFMPTFNF